MEEHREMTFELNTNIENPTCNMVRNFTFDNTTLIGTLQTLKVGLLENSINSLDHWIPSRAAIEIFEKRESLSDDIRNILNILPKKISSNNNINSEVDILFRCITSSINIEHPYSINDSMLSRLMLRIMFPFIQLNIIHSFNIYADQIIEYINNNSIWKSKDTVFNDIYYLSSISMGINDPSVYNFLIRLLKHPWCQFRSASSFALYNWKSSRIHEHYGESLKAWLDPSIPVETCSNIIASLGKLKTKEALIELEKYSGTRLDGVALRLAISDCKGELRTMAPRRRSTRRTA